MAKGVNPREILSDLGVENEQIPEYVDDVTIWKIIINMFAEPPRRNKLRHVNTLDDVVRLLKGNFFNKFVKSTYYIATLSSVLTYSLLFSETSNMFCLILF